VNFKKYVVAHSVNEVNELLAKSRNNIILGGMHWLKQNRKTYSIGIDISKLGLDEIIEFDDRIEIGAAVSLRDIEESELLKKYCNVLVEAVSKIVGVQFRNTATIGGSVYSRFGFSDVIAALLTTNTLVEVNGNDQIALHQFVQSKISKTFVTKIIIKKEVSKFAYYTMRKSATDIPYIIVSLSKTDNRYKVVVGARPSRAIYALETMKKLDEGVTDIEELTNTLLNEVDLGSNVFSSKDYREHLVKVFLKRGVNSLWK